MRYSRSVYAAAQGELERRKNTAQELAAAHRAQVTASCPELLIIEEQIRTAALGAAKLLTGSPSDASVLKKLERASVQAQKDRIALLKHLKLPEDYLDEQYTCPQCEDSGFISGRLCDCHARLLKTLACEELSRTSPSSFCGFDNFSLNYYSNKLDPEIGLKPRTIMKKTLQECREYADGFSLLSPSMYFCGGTGLGKTHLSLAIANEVTQRGFGVVYITTQNLMNRLEKEHFSKDSQEDTLELVLGCDLLIIDDLGTEFATTFTNAQLYNIINTRLLETKPVIISANLTYEDIEVRYDPRLASRIMSYRYVDFIGTDVRQQKVDRKEGDSDA